VKPELAKPQDQQQPHQHDSQHGGHAVPANCLNCNADISGNYCHNCGQETRTHAPSFMEFAHEFVGHYVALEGRLWGTFARLLFRPGALTNEYLAGRRKRYVEPLRLYLTLSILFFALLKFTNTEVINLDAKAPAAAEVAESVRQEARGIRREIIANGTVKDKEGRDVMLQDTVRAKSPRIADAIENFDKLPAERKGEALSDGFFRYGPYAMFALMPLFALYLKVLYLGSGKRYGEHLLFALHTSSFAFVMFAAIKLIPDDNFFTFVLLCWLVGYLPWAMRRVYGGSRTVTALRWMVLMMAHCISLAIAITVAMGAGVATAH
jgi:hypothetical protein